MQKAIFFLLKGLGTFCDSIYVNWLRMSGFFNKLEEKGKGNKIRPLVKSGCERFQIVIFITRKSVLLIRRCKDMPLSTDI